MALNRLSALGLLLITGIVVAVVAAAPAIHADSVFDGLVAARALQACPDPKPNPIAAPGPLPASARTGQLLVAHDRSGDASVVDLATGSIARIETGLTEPHEAAVSDDGRIGVLTDFGNRRGGQFMGNRAAVIDMTTRRLARVIDLGDARGAHGVAFIPGTHRAVITTQTSRRVVEVDADAGRVLASIGTGADGSHLITISHDGRLAWTVNEGDGTVSAIDLPSRALLATYGAAPETAEGIAVTPDGKELWVGSTTGGIVRILEPVSGRAIATLEGFANAARIAISRDGTRAVISDPRCGSWVVDVAARRKVGALHGASGGGTISPDGRVVYAGRAGERDVMIFDLGTLEIVRTVRLSEQPHGIAWSPPIPR